MTKKIQVSLKSSEQSFQKEYVVEPAQSANYLSQLSNVIKQTQEETNAALTKIVEEKKQSSCKNNSSNGLKGSTEDDEEADTETTEGDIEPETKKMKCDSWYQDLSMDEHCYLDPVTGKTWRKVLFDNSNDFPDNYTPDACFLAAIKRNQNLYKYTYSQCLLGSSQVSFKYI